MPSGCYGRLDLNTAAVHILVLCGCFINCFKLPNVASNFPFTSIMFHSFARLHFKDGDWMFLTAMLRLDLLPHFISGAEFFGHTCLLFVVMIQPTTLELLRLSTNLHPLDKTELSSYTVYGCTDTQNTQKTVIYNEQRRNICKRSHEI